MIIKINKNKKSFEFIEDESDDDTQSTYSNYTLDNSCNSSSTTSNTYVGTKKRYFINVRYEEKDDFKAAGCSWDKEEASWFWYGQRSKMPNIVKKRYKKG